ncbi:MAG: rhomboid family intramembrane serine protease [Candidatus Binatia bacterium]
MVLPIGDAPNPRGVPVVTYGLIAINVAIYLFVALPLGAEHPAPGDPLLVEYLRVVSHALHGRIAPALLAQQVTTYDLFLFTHGFRPAAPSAIALVVSMFLHAGLVHLAGNMLFLWIYGDNVERRLGPLRYALAYLGTGTAATLFHWVGAIGSPLPVVGASGAISGMLGFYFVWFPRNVVRLLWLLPPFLGHVFEVRARVVLGLYLVVDNVLPYLVVGGDVGVSHGAHIGGFVAGVAVAWLADRYGVVHRPLGYAGVVSSAPDDLGMLVDAGSFADAASTYFQLPARAARGALTPRQALDLAAWLRRNGHLDAALVLLRRVVRDEASGPELAAAHLELGTILLEDLGQPTPAYQHFLAALEQAADPGTRLRAREALAEIAARQKRRIGRPRPIA